MTASTDAYRGARVFLTGHTGFKGSWLATWLARLGARVTGTALDPETTPSAFVALDVAGSLEADLRVDVRDAAGLRAALREARPDVVFHLAAQPLVRKSYAEPLATFDTNVMGTAHVLDALRPEERRVPVVVVTTDKCYENREWVHGYRESDALGGHDPYSSSKAAAELVAASYRKSFALPVATARAGNVIGGGDWAADRLVPDAVDALAAGRPIPVRNPAHVRPWQHVIEPLHGYLLLGAGLLAGDARCAGAWNFGPFPDGTLPVREVVEEVIAAWGSGSWEDGSSPGAPHEGHTLRLSVDKAVAELGWRPRWGTRRAVAETVAWYRAFHEGRPPAALRELACRQIDAYLETP